LNMKIKILLFCLVLLSVNTLRAQGILFFMINDEIIEYGIGEIEKITFSPTQVEVHVEGQVDVLEIAEIEFYTYAVLTSLNSADSERLQLTVFPNPVKNQLSVNYSITESGPVNISLYDMQGRMVASIYSGAQPAGTHRYDADIGAFGLSAGAYQCRIQQGAYTNGKLILFQP